MSCPKCAPTVQTLPRPDSSVSVALVGNPNTGKSTLFNALTGSKQHCVNAPGTTVECMVGTWQSANVRLMDLPGTYSLLPKSPDEQVVVDTLVQRTSVPGGQEAPLSLALVVLDATSLERSLYLAGQVAQTGLPVACVVTLADVARQDGIELDPQRLERALKVPVTVVDPRHRPQARLDEFIARALANPAVIDVGGSLDATGDFGDKMENAEQLFEWVEQILARAGLNSANLTEPSFSDKVDRILLNPFLGLPIFFAVMWLLFELAGSWVSPLQDFFENLFASTESGAFSLANGLSWVLGELSLADSCVHSLLVNGLATGLGVVASFLPLMLVIFLAISVLEDSGYMARAAFLADRIMRKIGLDGRAVLPLIMGFGCNLPSLAACRTLSNRNQRIITTLIIPYTSCAARLTIYLLIAKVFFPRHTGTVVWAMYVTSILLVVAAAWIAKHFLPTDSEAPLMLVLPAYQCPRVLLTLRRAWLRSWAFVKGAGKIIVLLTMIVWLMSSIPLGQDAAQKHFADPTLTTVLSLYGKTAKALEPVFAPTGFGEWHMTGALMTGFVAKETVISSIVTSYNMDPENDGGDAEDGGNDLGKLPTLLRDSLTKSAGEGNEPIAALAFLVFVLAYTPCMATVAEQVRQIGGRLTAAAVLGQLVLAWILSVGIFQIGTLIFR